jgi:hypothetical protein
MNDEQFDALARDAMRDVKAAPSEQVWRRIQARERLWLPRPREMLVAWAGSASALLLAFALVGDPRDLNQPSEPFNFAATEGSARVVAAVTSLSGDGPNSRLDFQP